MTLEYRILADPTKTGGTIRWNLADKDKCDCGCEGTIVMRRSDSEPDGVNFNYWGADYLVNYSHITMGDIHDVVSHASTRGDVFSALRKMGAVVTPAA